MSTPDPHQPATSHPPAGEAAGEAAGPVIPPDQVDLYLGIWLNGWMSGYVSYGASAVSACGATPEQQRAAEQAMRHRGKLLAQAMRDDPISRHTVLSMIEDQITGRCRCPACGGYDAGVPVDVTGWTGPRPGAGS